MMITLKQFAVQFIDWVDHSQSLEKKSRQYYRHGWNLLSATRLCDEKLDRIKNRDCDTLLFPGGAANANTALRTLRRMFSHAQELELVEQAPKIRLRKEWPRSVAMTQQQANAILAHMPDGDPRDVLSILRATGMRPGEAYGMRWEFVGWEEKIYRNPKGKTKSARRPVPLLDPSGAVLVRRHLAQGSPNTGWVFPAISSSGHRTSIQKAFVRARNLAGLPKEYVIYSARHGAATDIASVVSLKEVMNILGHSDMATALRYQHPSTENLQARLTQKLQ